MEETISRMLDGVIENQINSLDDLDVGSKERTTAINDLVSLYKLKIEDTKSNWEFWEARDKREVDEENRKQEMQLKDNQLKEEEKARYFKLGVDVAGIVLPLMFYGLWMRKGFKFEEDGTFTSTTFKSLFQKFKPTGK